MAILQSQKTYTVTAKTSNGCQASDGLSIKVYLRSDIFVPSGFSPNGDGHNDVLKPIVEGIREFKYFAVFNRWGQRIFYSADPSKGWDASLNGSPQQSDTYVWMTEGVPFKGEIISNKGTVVLVR